VEVHHGEDEDAGQFFGVEDSIGKSPGLASPHFACEDGPSLGLLGRTTDGGIDFKREVKTQMLLSLLVVVDGSDELLFGLWVEEEVYVFNRFRILAKTCSPGIGSTLPERSSARRRWAAWAHLRSILASGALRLRRIESATMARSSTGREATSSMISFIVTG
jgi:hypothetical protein